MLSAWVVTGLFSLALSWGEDRPMMLPRFSGCALGSAGIPPPAASHPLTVSQGVLSELPVGYLSRDGCGAAQVPRIHIGCHKLRDTSCSTTQQVTVVASDAEGIL